MFIKKGQAELSSPNGRGKSMRYDDGFLMQCMLLKMKSNAAYNHLRNRKILPLPHPDRIRTMLSSTSCRFGFNEVALDAIKNELENLPPEKRWGTLIWDEMKIKRDVSWNKSLLEWRGRVDFGDGIMTPIPDGIADHVLVLMFRPYTGRWIQPIACFASKGAASGEILHEIVSQAIITLFNNNAIVKSTVSDGASPNYKAMRYFGIDGRGGAEDTKSFFLHPLDDQIKVFHFVDPPHLLKCVRNHVFTHKLVQVIIEI